MNTSTNLPPGGYVPPSAPAKRSGPGCWVWGLVGCLTIFVIGGIFIGFIAYKVAKSPEGSKIFKTMGSVMNKAQGLGEATKNMMTIREALIRYHEHTGNYPASLNDLVPDYLPDASILHSSIDNNTDSKHVSYEYAKPAASEPGSSPLLSVDFAYDIQADKDTINQDTKIILSLDGHTSSSLQQSITVPPGAAPPSSASVKGATIHKNADGSTTYTMTPVTRSGSGIQ